MEKIFLLSNSKKASWNMAKDIFELEKRIIKNY